MPASTQVRRRALAALHCILAGLALGAAPCRAELRGPPAGPLPPQQEAVVFIPGIAGTALLDGAAAVWPPRPWHLLSDFAALQCDRTGHPLKNLAAGEPLDDYYGALVRTLQQQAYPVYRFGYDWRLDIVQSADQLQTFIAALPAARVTLLAHSMGGLVAASYLQRHGAQHVKRLITLGTPFLGTPGTLKILERGDFLDGLTGYLLRPAFLKLFKDHPAWYQLLPTQAYFAGSNSYYVRKVLKGAVDHYTEFRSEKVTDAFIRSRPWASAALVDKHDDFLKHSELLAAVKSTDAYFIIGEGQPTTGYLDFVYHSVGDDEVFDQCRPIRIDGDGSVVVRSANLAGQAEVMHPGHSYYLNETHRGLTRNSLVAAQIVRILQGDAKPLLGLRPRALH